MRVRALKLGYYDLKRKKEGEVFEMDEQAYAPKNADGTPKVGDNGKPIICSWVELLDEQQASSKKVKTNYSDKYASSKSEVI